MSGSVHVVSYQRKMSVAKVLWVRFLGQIEAALPRRLIPFWKAPAGKSFLAVISVL